MLRKKQIASRAIGLIVFIGFFVGCEQEKVIVPRAIESVRESPGSGNRKNPEKRTRRKIKVLKSQSQVNNAEIFDRGYKRKCVAIFGAKWCKPCQDLVRSEWLDKVVQERSDILFVYVDIGNLQDREKRFPTWLDKYEIDAIPTFVYNGSKTEGNVLSEKSLRELINSN